MTPRDTPTPNPRLAELADEISRAEDRLNDLLEERYTVVAEDFDRGCSPSEIAAAAGVARQRIYKLRESGIRLRAAG